MSRPNKAVPVKHSLALLPITQHPPEPAPKLPQKIAYVSVKRVGNIVTRSPLRRFEPARRIPFPVEKSSMDATLHALGDLLIKAIPTALFFIFLAVYLQQVFFKPMARILEERRRQTEGVRELARQAMEAADKKTSEFEHALQLARVEIHAEHEKLRQQWIQEQARRIAEARAEADRQIQEARAEIFAEVQKAEVEMAANVEALGEQIVSTLLKRRAA